MYSPELYQETGKIGVKSLKGFFKRVGERHRPEAGANPVDKIYIFNNLIIVNNQLGYSMLPASSIDFLISGQSHIFTPVLSELYASVIFKRDSVKLMKSILGSSLLNAL